MVWPLAGGMAFALLRTLALTWRRRRRPSLSFAWYVLGIGLMGAAGYVATRVVAENTPRYYLLALFIPVGVTAVFLASEPRVWLRRAMIALVTVWAVFSGVDHAQLFARYDGGREPNEPREMADALEARQLHVAQSDYWRAYKLTFLTGERVKVASTDFARIDEYQKLAVAAGNQLVTIQPHPCMGGEHLTTWFLCRNP
jgi:hypothetical protein